MLTPREFDECMWRQDGVNHGHGHPAAAHRLLRLPLVRHLRCGLVAGRRFWIAGADSPAKQLWLLTGIARGYI